MHSADEENDLATLESETLKFLPLKDNSGFVSMRRKRKVIRYCNFNKITEEMNYYREQLLLFTSWRTEPVLGSDRQDQYNRNLEQVLKNRKNYCKYEDIF